MKQRTSCRHCIGQYLIFIKSKSFCWSATTFYSSSNMKTSFLWLWYIWLFVTKCSCYLFMPLPCIKKYLQYKNAHDYYWFCNTQRTVEFCWPHGSWPPISVYQWYHSAQLKQRCGDSKTLPIPKWHGARGVEELNRSHQEQQAWTTSQS